MSWQHRENNKRFPKEVVDTNVHEQEQGAKTTKLGLIVLCRAITKKLMKSRLFCAQYIDITINRTPSRAMVDTHIEVNIITKTKTTRFGQCRTNSREWSRRRSKLQVRRVAR